MSDSLLRSVVAAAAVLALGLTVAAPASSRTTVAAPARPAQESRIAGQYIVVLKGSLPRRPTRPAERRALTEDGNVASSVHARPLDDYDADLTGFAADLSATQFRKLEHNRHVKFIEPDERVRETAVARAATTDVETPAPWGLDRIDQRSLPLDNAYHYPSTGGAGITAYVIDTGIDTSSPDFGSRASFGANLVDRTNTDANGHGTHVAGIIGGATWGVAKQVRLVDVKVLNASGSGTISSVIAGINWVEAHAVPDKSVVNMSLGAAKNTAVDEATAHLVGAGVFVVVAAGNNNSSACDFSPARTPEAFTVGATDSSDRKATFSNQGPCLDAYAPGVAITSDWLKGGTNTISGTSMAAPFVTGLAALYLAEHPSTPAEVTSWLIDNATTGVVAGSPANTPNRLIFDPAS